MIRTIVRALALGVLVSGASLSACSAPGGTGAGVGRAAPLSAARPEPAPSATFAFLKFGGYDGELFKGERSGAQFEYSESVAVEFTQELDTKTFTYTITPATPSSVYFGNDYVRTATFTVRKVPGTTYTLTIPAGTRDVNGDVLAHAVVKTFTTASVPPVQKPSYHTHGQPYRYGVLEHPFPASLSGPTGPQQIATLAAAGARFVRIDYCGAQSELEGQGSFDFTIEDGIMDQLAADNVTELPIVDQYCSPPWGNGGSNSGTPVWSTPALYAQFAAGVAAHVAAKYPQITRMEFFNEPNLAPNWDAPAPYNSTTGSATAAYMQAAYAAVKAVAPSMTIVGPALGDGGTGVTDPRTFLQNMYAAGCKTGSCWDVLSVHNYAWMNPNFASEPDLPSTYFNRWDVYKDLEAIALANGEPVPPHVMLTEWGISTDTASPSGFDPAVQADYISIAFNKMDADPTVDGLVYTNIYNPGTDFFSLMALTTANFALLPGYDVYKKFAAH